MRHKLAAPILATVIGVGLFGCAPPPPPPAKPVVEQPKPPLPDQPTQNAPMCVRPAEKAAFDLAALTSHMKVITINCHTEDRYNAFVGKFRGEMIGGERALSGYFQRAYGGRARSQQDSYDTQLFNAASQFAIRHGTLFCPQNLGMLDELEAMKTTSDLPAYAASKPLQQSMAITECPPPAAAPAKPAAKKP